MNNAEKPDMNVNVQPGMTQPMDANLPGELKEWNKSLTSSCCTGTCKLILNGYRLRFGTGL